MAIKEVLELVIKGDAKGAIEAFRGTSTAADGAEKSVGLVGGLFDKVTTKFPIAGRAAEKFGIDAGNAGTVAAGAATAAATAVGVFVAKSVTAYQDLAGGVLKVQRATELTAEESSRFVAVFDDYNMSAEQGALALGKFEKAIATTPEALAALGVQLDRNKDGTINLEATLGNAADAFANTTDVTKRAELGNKLFEKSWQDMVPLLEGGARGLTEAFKAVPKGQILSQDDIDTSEEFRFQVDGLKDSFLELEVSVGKAVLPTLRGAVTVITELAKATGTVTSALTDSKGEVYQRNIAMRDMREAAKAAADEQKRLAAEMLAASSSGRQAANQNAKAAAESADMQRVLSDGYIINTQAARNNQRVQQDVADTNLVVAQRTGQLAKADEYLEQATKDATAAADEFRRSQEELLATGRDLYLSTLDLDEAIDNFGDKLDDVHLAQDGAKKATKEHGVASDETAAALRREEDAVRDAQREIAGIAKKAEDAAVSQAGLAGHVATVEEKVSAQKNALIELGKRYPEAQGAIDDYIARALDPLISKYDEAERKGVSAADTVAAAWRNADGQVTRTADRVARESGESGAAAPAGGWPVDVLAVKGRTAGVFANNSSGGAGMGNTYNITFNGVVDQNSARVVMDSIKVYERTNGTGWRS